MWTLWVNRSRGQASTIVPGSNLRFETIFYDTSAEKNDCLYVTIGLPVKNNNNNIFHL